ncbi:hypothetical protein EMPG_11503 [Blastomyces silverae]|uniref:Uncharacterized protein n=1 Tax=Blastomyces silverae TaxID=2060906 RepID=A0A0H1BQD3_9EURO|nr:hypothetical protein EMPG_11503 [Blastomyces silverae]
MPSSSHRARWAINWLCARCYINHLILSSVAGRVTSSCTNAAWPRCFHKRISSPC